MSRAAKLVKSLKIWALLRIIEIVAVIIFAAIVWSNKWTPEYVTGVDAVISGVRVSIVALLLWYITFLYALISWIPIIIFSFKGVHNIWNFVATICIVYMLHAGLVNFLMSPEFISDFPNGRYLTEWTYLLLVNIFASWQIGRTFVNSNS